MKMPRKSLALVIMFMLVVFTFCSCNSKSTNDTYNSISTDSSSKTSETFKSESSNDEMEQSKEISDKNVQAIMDYIDATLHANAHSMNKLIPEQILKKYENEYDLSDTKINDIYTNYILKRLTRIKRDITSPSDMYYHLSEEEVKEKIDIDYSSIVIKSNIEKTISDYQSINSNLLSSLNLGYADRYYTISFDVVIEIKSEEFQGNIEENMLNNYQLDFILIDDKIYSLTLMQIVEDCFIGGSSDVRLDKNGFDRYEEEEHFLNLSEHQKNIIVANNIAADVQKSVNTAFIEMNENGTNFNNTPEIYLIYNELWNIEGTYDFNKAELEELIKKYSHINIESTQMCIKVLCKNGVAIAVAIENNGYIGTYPTLFTEDNADEFVSSGIGIDEALSKAVEKVENY